MYIQVLEYTLHNTVHEHGDLMARDIEFSANKLKNKSLPKALQSARDFTNYDEEYFSDVYIPLRNEIKALAPHIYIYVHGIGIRFLIMHTKIILVILIG